MSNHAIHHVTAVTAQIEKNMEFYTQVLGLRLVKRSVNQDDVSAYHLFYADGAGSPGTDMTFFDWPSIGANRTGAGTIALTSFRIPAGSLGYWEGRLEQAECAPERGENSLLFSDPEGQRLELVGDDGVGASSAPWTAVVPAEHAIRGILGVDLESARPDATQRVITEILGYRESAGGAFEAAGDRSYGRLRIVPSVSGRFGRVGAGGVHHVAFRVENDDELNEMMEKVEEFGLRTSGYVDRFYFHSVYFREPGGVLFELATDGPGFASDEDQAHLGEKLALPPFLEPRRREIEAGLKPLPDAFVRSDLPAKPAGLLSHLHSRANPMLFT
ncbi:MAG TPA: ring-cleaving dioxygenase [Fimbriimonadaceae bacterium]|nr:ring-cleaving dioxygenase [Fimbriimonadaceae bacterium]